MGQRASCHRTESHGDSVPLPRDAFHVRLASRGGFCPAEGSAIGIPQSIDPGVSRSSRGDSVAHRPADAACARLSGMTLDKELDRIFAARDRANMQPTIDALLPLLASNPGNARVLYEVGGAYDTAGKEETALGFYENALAAGLKGDLLRRCYVQYGSTLRNVGQYAKSSAVFATARTEFPGSPSLGVFEAITLHAAGRPDEAIASLLDVVVDFVRSPDIDRYKSAISGNAAYLRSLDGRGTPPCS